MPLLLSVALCLLPFGSANSVQDTVRVSHTPFTVTKKDKESPLMFKSGCISFGLCSAKQMAFFIDDSESALLPANATFERRLSGRPVKQVRHRLMHDILELNPEEFALLHHVLEQTTAEFAVLTVQEEQNARRKGDQMFILVQDKDKSVYNLGGKATGMAYLNQFLQNLTHSHLSKRRQQQVRALLDEKMASFTK